MTSTCCPALVYEGHSCDRQTGLFKGAPNVCGTGNAGRGGALLLHFTEIHVIVMFNFKCVAPRSSNRKQRKTSERFSRCSCADGAIFSSEPYSFPFSWCHRQGCSTTTCSLLRGSSVLIQEDGELLKRVITKRRKQTRENCPFSRNSLSFRLRWNHVGLVPLVPFKDGIFSFSASSLKRNDPDPLGLKLGLTGVAPPVAPMWECHLIHILVVLVVAT